MRAVDLILVNWGPTPDEAYALPEIAAFTGDTGAGKTSIIDASIAVMTGASTRLGKFNVAADDGHGVRHRNVVYRTLPSYILGAQDQAYARPKGAHGYAAMTFEPAVVEKAKPFSAIIGGSAVLSETELPGGGKKREPSMTGRPHLIVVVGAVVSLSDFMVPRNDEQKQVIPPEKLTDALRAKYPGAKVIHFGDEHLNYVRKIYGLFRGRDEVSAPEAEGAAIAFSRFVSQEHIEDISKFVREFVLSSPDYFRELDDIAGNMKKSKKLKDQATAMRQRLDALVRALSFSHDFTEQVVRAKIMEEAAIRREKNDAEAAAKRAGTSLTQISDKNRIEQRDLDALRQVIARDEDAKTGIKARLLGIPAYQQRGELQATQGALITHLTGLTMEARSRAKALAGFANDLPRVTERLDTFQSFNAIERLLREAFSANPMNAAVGNALQNAAANIPEDGRDAAAWGALRTAAMTADSLVGGYAQELCGPERVLRSEIAAAVQSQKQIVEKLGEEIEALTSEVNRIERGANIQYPNDVDRALAYLREHLPESDPSVLCDLVSEVLDTTWQAAIEGYIGGTRFNILVKPQTEKAANRLLQDSGLRRGATVIQSELAMQDAKKMTLKPDSIVRELKVENPYAKAFLEARFGGTIKVERIEDIHKVPMGVTKAGRGSRGYTTFNCMIEDGDLTFGVQARQKRLQARREQIERLTKGRGELQTRIQRLETLKLFEGVLDALSRGSLTDVCAKALDAVSQFEGIRQQIDSIDVSGAADLEKQLDAINKKIKVDTAQRDMLHQSVVKNNLEADRYSKLLDHQEKLAEEAQQRADAEAKELKSLIRLAHWVDAPAMKTEADAMVVDIGASPDALKKHSQSALNRLDAIRGYFVNSVGIYNSLAVSDEEKFDANRLLIDGDRQIEPDSGEAFTIMADISVKLETQVASLRNNTLTKLEAEISSIAETIKQAFSTHFCTKIASEVDNAKNVLKGLNAELSTHKFGEDRFEFDDEWASKDFKDRYALFDAVMQKSVMDNFDMFAEGALEPELARVRDEIFALFLSSEDDARRRLLQIADYRNYKSYDLFKLNGEGDNRRRVSLSKQLTGSGGEKETGLFVARVATISGAFRLRQIGPHLGMVIIDELFKKTGEARIRQAIEYLHNTLGLQVIFAMPTRSFGPFKDLVHGEHRLTRVPASTPVGEVNTSVIHEYYAYNKSAVIELRQKKREAVREQATFDFNQREAGNAT